jgi:hypothetical protein
VTTAKTRTVLQGIETQKQQARVELRRRPFRERHRIWRMPYRIGDAYLARTAATAQAKRSPGPRPVRSSGGRRATGATRAGPDEDPDPPGVAAPPARRETAVRCP